MAAPLHFAQVVVDCANAKQLAGFYAALLDREMVEDSNEFFAFLPASADPPWPGLMFLQVPEPRQGKNRVHIDLHTQDRAAATAKAVALGATKLGEFDEFGAIWTTLSDPEGNVFDIAEHPPGPPAG